MDVSKLGHSRSKSPFKCTYCQVEHRVDVIILCTCSNCHRNEVHQKVSVCFPKEESLPNTFLCKRKGNSNTDLIPESKHYHPLNALSTTLQVLQNILGKTKIYMGQYGLVKRGKLEKLAILALPSLQRGTKHKQTGLEHI